MIGTCNLCGNLRELCESHIFPKFIFRWMKETGTGMLRQSDNLNLRKQDGLKTKFLCLECEDRFSKSETYFATQIFYPIVGSNAEKFTYDRRLYYFAISVCWRLLKFGIVDKKPISYHNQLLKNLEEEWRQYLFLGNNIHTFDKIHLLTGVDVLSEEDIAENKITVPHRFIQYIARWVDGDVAENEELCFLYIKLPRFIFIFPVLGFTENVFINTRIYENGGNYILNKAEVKEPTIGSYFLDRVKAFNDLMEKVSPTQKQKMHIAYLNNLKEILKKDLGIITKYEEKKYGK